jgi:hemoglobin
VGTPDLSTRVRAVLDDFYERVFADRMIGFFFKGRDKQRLVDTEVSLTLEALGEPGVSYVGRDLRAVHKPLKVMGGHFDRRAQLLKETLKDHAFPPDFARAWLDHVESLRPEITGQRPGECD